MEDMVNLNLSFWSGKKVLITGHTGFKGSWLMIWLKSLNAEVYGFSLDPDADLNLFSSIPKEFISENIHHYIGDIRDKSSLNKIIKKFKPDIVFHLAAQALVKRGYQEPLFTWETNVIGSLNLLEIIKENNYPCSIVIVTTDKVYKNNEWIYGYREVDQLGGYDPYSASKAALEIAVSSWRDSFCNPKINNIKIATARAGNVIGGGDWAANRIIPDAIRSLMAKNDLIIRNPNSTRPWQHVLEPLWGYMLLAKSLYLNHEGFCEPFNFGPQIQSNRTVKEVVEKIFQVWPGTYIFKNDEDNHHEAERLYLQIDKVYQKLNWQPKIGFEKSIEKTTLWYKDFFEGQSSLDCCQKDINFYQELL